MLKNSEIYIGTVCLEKNRWNGKSPELKVSDWLDKFHHAKFDGIELWEKHFILADNEEQEKLLNSKVPIKILNTYATGDKGGEIGLANSLSAIEKIKPSAIKFNFGRDFANMQKSIDNTVAWLKEIPKNIRLLCELHPNTIVSIDDVFHSSKVLDEIDLPIEVIIHTCLGEIENIEKLFTLHPNRITHTHMAYLRNREITIDKRIDILKHFNFQGTHTIEFTYGVAMENENSEELFINATSDKNLLKALI